MLWVAPWASLSSLARPRSTSANQRRYARTSAGISAEDAARGFAYGSGAWGTAPGRPVGDVVTRGPESCLTGPAGGVKGTVGPGGGDFGSVGPPRTAWLRSPEPGGSALAPLSRPQPR